MPFPGGSSDKLGNRYESWWTVLVLQKMLLGEGHSLRIEKPSLDDAEFVVQCNGYQELHQTKRSHPTGQWTISSLAAKDQEVLQAMFEQLDGNDDRFVFVSSSHAAELNELVFRANSAETASEFEKVGLEAKAVKDTFERLRKAWKQCTVEKAWGVLRRIEIRSIDEYTLRDQARDRARALFLSDPQAVCSALRTIVLDSVHQTITRDDLIERMRESGFALRRLTNGLHASAVVKEATNQYLADAKRRLIRNTLMRRSAVDKLLSMLGTTARDVVVTGRAGTGKTACMVAFVEELVALDVPVLAIRLDRIEPISTTSELGTKLAFEDSPALILAAAAQGREAVLVIDQLDAVSTTSGRAIGFLEAVEGLLIEARGLRVRHRLHMIVVCRDFDWNNDHRLRTILLNEHAKVEIGEFAPDEVSRILVAEGFSPNQFQPGQLRILSLPQNLSMFLGCDFDPTRPPAFNTAIDLFDRYWKEKRRAVNLRAIPTSDCWVQVIDALVDEMAATQQLSVPQERLDAFPEDYIEQMASEGVVSLSARRYAFSHESFFDYCFARSFMRANQSLVSFLTSSEQHLFRRTQVRQVLTYLRGADRNRYLREMQDLLSASKIRPHLKALTISLLSDVPDPSDEEWTIWEHVLSPFLQHVVEGRAPTDKFSAMSWYRFSRSRSWFRYAVDKVIIENWLSSADPMADTVIPYICWHQRQSPDLVVALLERYVGLGGGWSARLRYVVQWSNPFASRRFFELFLGLIEDGTLDDLRSNAAANGTFWSMMSAAGKGRPEWVPELLARWMRRRMTLANVAGMRLQQDPSFGKDYFADRPILESARSAPAPFVQYVLPIILQISDDARNALQESPKQDAVWPYWFEYTDRSGPSAATLEGLKTSLRLLAKDLAVDLSPVISELRSRETNTANSLLLTLYAANGARFGNEAIALLGEDPWRFRCFCIENEYWLAMEAIGAAVPHCSAENRARLEEVVLDYVAPSERLPDGYRSMGKACFNLLSAIPEGLRSTVANARFRELERKFRQPYQAPRAISGGWVESPIDANAVTKMTDEQWLRALRKYNTDCSLVTQSDNFLRGGAVELARQLETCVVREPERFARLALQFPSDTNFQYYVHTLRGIQSAEISGDLKLQVCHKAYADCREDCGEAIADLLGEIDDPLPVDSIAMLDWLGTDHPDPESQASDDDASDDLDAYTKGLNTTRGRAALAVAVLIYKDAAYIERFNATLMRMIRDSSSAVLSCVADAIRAVMQHDVQDGLSLLAQMDITDDSLLATPSVYELVKRALQSNFQEVRSLVERMLRSERSRAAVNGAMLAALACFFHPEAEELAAEALAGNAHQRLGLAKVSAANISWERSRSWCQQRLVVLFDDADEAVRREAALAFRSLEGADPEEYADLVQSFSNSKAFCDDPSPILDVLRESIRRLPGTTCHICEKFLERFRNGASSGCTSHVGDAHTVVELLFRTYQQHQEGEWAKRSLDLIDRLCLENFDVVDETFQAFER